MTISAHRLFMKHHRINVTRVFDVNERHHDALRRGMGDLIGHVFYHSVSLTVQMAWYHINTVYVSHKYKVRIA